MCHGPRTYAASAIVLSFDFWMRRYNGDREVLNRTLEIDHKPYTAARYPVDQRRSADRAQRARFAAVDRAGARGAATAPVFHPLRTLLFPALALVGLYSVVTYSVAQRTNEFGIRMALGAQRAHVLWIVSRSIGLTVVSGLAAGLLVFVTLHGLLTHIAGNSGLSPFILVGVTALFILCAAFACRIPAMRATSIEPMQALRTE